MADIEKMFRQVLVTPQHRNLQRIIWRESPSSEIGIYCLTTVTYGMTCSPYNAIRTLHQCAQDNYDVIADNKQALISRDAILRSFYVDDFLTSCDSKEEAILLAKNIDKILSCGHFRLRKWNSNIAQVTDRITGENASISVLLGGEMAVAVLGLQWNAAADNLFYHVSLDASTNPTTKRRVLSEVARLFDPIGLVAPVIVTSKIFIQQMWSSGIGWDDILPVDLNTLWMTFRTNLSSLNSIQIPRWVGMKYGQLTELHGFCDASSKAYAAVIYTKTISKDGNSCVTLLTARTRVAPLKGTTIPRLELCAAHLLALTLDNVRNALNLKTAPYHLWSDSRIVLCWLQKQLATLKPFISNRVRQIQELTSSQYWHHVKSAQNPADCASRGMSAAELLSNKLWWNGPQWLVEESLELNQEITLNEDELALLKLGQRVTALPTVASVGLNITTRQLDGKLILLLDRFSALQKVLRTVAYLLRWTPSRHHLRNNTVSAQELEEALEKLVLIEQHNNFGTELKQLQSGLTLQVSSRLLNLNPFIDERKIMRLGVRLRHARLPHDQRFPIILPKNGTLVRLIIQKVHMDTLHGGVQLMLHTLRNRFWILNARQTVKSCIHHCVICRRHRRTTIQQQMAPLPSQRVNAARPFSASGVDYCGPFTLRIGNKRSKNTVKTYLAIFICMATKAVHIEVVDDLSSQAFLDAFTRFVSRRGPCLNLFSDNGTAFIGAYRKMKEDLASWKSDHSQQAIANMGTNWNFISQGSPHQGGLWEAAVKSAKHHLIRIVGTQIMWHGQLQTLVARIEACLNSRPLVALHDDPEDKLALTPGDFLIGSPLIAVPEPDVSEIPFNRLKHWQWLQQLHQQFWHRWSEEYLATLQTRNKWQRPVEDIKMGDIVVVRHENLPPTHWRLGRVIEVHPGKDGLIRNATIKTSNGVCTRAVQKLCRLLDADSLESKDSTGQNVMD